jgi:hypothetical protein
MLLVFDLVRDVESGSSGCIGGDSEIVCAVFLKGAEGIVH